MNLPLAAVLVASAYWLALQLSDQGHDQRRARPQHARLSDRHAEFVLPVTASTGNKPEGKWKEQVGSPVVVHAWETLSGSIVQEVSLNGLHHVVIACIMLSCRLIFLLACSAQHGDTATSQHVILRFDLDNIRSALERRVAKVAVLCMTGLQSITAVAYMTSCMCCMQFLYDLWWGHITPDTEFPKDVRRVLNSAFGELAMRAQQVDLKRMLLP